MKKYGRIHNSKLAFHLFLLCWFVYFSSYLGRLNYSSAMTVMLEDGVLTKTQAGFISMIYFFAYGVGQCLNGFAGDRIDPKRMVSCGLMVSALMNVVMTFARSFPLMAAAWLINGYAQSTIWPPIIRIFSDMLEKKKKVKYCVDIVSTQAAGTFASYFLSAVIIAHAKWQFVFLAAGLILFLAVLIWNLGFAMVAARSGAEVAGDANRALDAVSEKGASGEAELQNMVRTPERERTEPQTELPVQEAVQKPVQAVPGTQTAQASEKKAETTGGNGGFSGLVFASGMFMLIFPVFVHGILKDGIVSWVPTYISEVFDAGASLAVLLTAIIPVINLSGAYIGRYVFKRMGGDEVKASVLFFSIAAAALFVLCEAGTVHMVLTALLLSVITASMMAVNTLFINLYPLRFEKEGRVASVSGFLNATAYLGTAISTYCIGLLVQSRGWNVTIASWLFATLLALFICVMSVFRMRRKREAERTLNTCQKSLENHIKTGV